MQVRRKGMYIASNLRHPSITPALRFAQAHTHPDDDWHWRGADDDANVVLLPHRIKHSTSTFQRPLARTRAFPAAITLHTPLIIPCRLVTCAAGPVPILLKLYCPKTGYLIRAAAPHRPISPAASRTAQPSVKRWKQVKVVVARAMRSLG
jgi:hypothetical protein